MATIPFYQPPQSTITQILAVEGATSTPVRPAIVIGPAYALQRYGIDPAVPATPFLAAGFDVNYTYRDEVDDTTLRGLPTGAVVDPDYTRLAGKNLEAILATYATLFTIESLDAPNVIRFTGADNLNGGTLNASLRGRAVAAGDRVVINDGFGSRRRKVVGYRGKPIAASYGGNEGGTDTDLANSAYNPITAAASFTSVTVPPGFTVAAVSAATFNGLVAGAFLNGKYGEEFTLTVVTGGAPGVATFDITSKSGLFYASAVASTVNAGKYSITSVGGLAGVVIEITKTAATDVVAGQAFKFQVFGAYTRISASQFALSDIGAGFTGPQDTVYTIRVKNGTSSGSGYAGAVLEITDSAGIDVASTVVVANDTFFDVGSYGLRAEFDTAISDSPQDGLRTGDTYYVRAVSAKESSTEFTGLILDGPAVDTAAFINASTPLTSVEFRLIYTGPLAANGAEDGVAWVPTSTVVTVDPALALFIPERTTGYQWVPFADAIGEVHLTWRAARAAMASKLVVSSDTIILSSLGRITPDNDLAFGVWCARRRASGLDVLALGTGAGTLSNFNAAFRKLETTDLLYPMAILTDDPQVRQATVTHVDAMSLPAVKNFRRAYVATESPGAYPALVLDSSGSPFTATISNFGGQNVFVTTTNAEADFLTTTLAGDLFVLPNTGETFEIAEVVSETELRLVTGPIAPVSPAAPFEIHKADTAENQVDFIVRASQALASRRVVNVWTEGGTAFYDDVLQVVPVRFIAAEIAGYVSALPAQQGLTGADITTITAAAPTYTRYTREQLNTIAAAGTLIVAEDSDSSGVTIRHQLTTSVAGGLLYYEDSVGRIVDNISFAWKAIFKKYIGKRNVTAQTVASLDHELRTVLDAATLASNIDTAGPLIVGYRDFAITQDAVMKDRLKVRVVIQVPVPLNYIEATIEAEAAEILTLAA